MERIVQQRASRRRFDDVDGDLDTSRPHDELVSSIMDEELARKRARKEPLSGAQKKTKGLTLAEVEDQEGGTVKESKIGMAAPLRAQRRKQKASKDETELLGVEDLEGIEEALEKEEDDGIKLEPFNLAQERQEGHFDEGGNYVENREEEDPSLQDAWLASNDAKVMSRKEREIMEMQRSRMATAERAPLITALQTSNLFRKVAALLHTGETVNQALRRLLPRPAIQERRSSQQKVRSHQGPAKHESLSKAALQPAPKFQPDAKAKLEFDSLTEMAMTLLDAGELDVYSLPKEELEAKAAEQPAEAEDLDMFGGSEVSHSADLSKDASLNQQQQLHVPTHTTEEPPTLTPAAQMEEVNAVNYASWPVKELARFLREHGHDSQGIIEKAELVSMVAQIASQGPEGVEATAPPGYVWDPNSNYFHSAQQNMYFDVQSGYFFSSNNEKWYTYDSETGNYDELKTRC